MMWLIVILVLCCAALITYQPDADKVTGFFGFAATLTSLFLGAIAIFYAIIANQGFSTTLGSLQRSSENMEAAARNINSTSGALATQSDRLVNEFTQLSPTVMGMSEKIDQINASSSANATTGRAVGKWWAKRKNLGSILALYSVAKSYSEKKPVSCGEIFPDNIVWQQYFLGFIDALYLTSIDGLEIDRDQADSTVTRPYTVVSLGSLSAKDLITAAEGEDSVKGTKLIIDGYFGTSNSMDPS